jgi:hypothetical protein
VPKEEGNEGRRRDLEEILELRRSFGTLGRRLGTRQGPIRPGLVEFPKSSVQAEPDPEPAADQDEGEDQDQVRATLRRVAPVVDETYHAPRPPAPGGDKAFEIPEPPPARRRLPWPWLAGLAAVVVLGIVVGYAVRQPPAPPPVSSQATPAPSAPPSSAAPANPPGSVVPQSCLTTAQRADVLIHMLVEKTRGLDVTKALKSYTEASQTCRKEASSR